MSPFADAEAQEMKGTKLVLLGSGRPVQFAPLTNYTFLILPDKRFELYLKGAKNLISPTTCKIMITEPTLQVMWKIR